MGWPWLLFCVSAASTARWWSGAERWAPVGAGIALSINAMGVLRRIECDRRLLDRGHVMRRAEVTDHRGRVLAASDLAAVSERHGPSVAVHRADLHEALLDAAQGCEVRLGCSVEQLDERDDVVVAHLTDGSLLDCDVVVGADGIGSQVRRLLFGQVDRRYSGYTCWRFVLERPPEIDRITEMWGPGRRFGIVPIGERLYCFSTANSAAGDRHNAELGVDGFRRLFSDFGGSVPAVLAAMGEDTELLHNDLEDIQLSSWSRGRVGLIGDAAHAGDSQHGSGGGARSGGRSSSQ